MTDRDELYRCLSNAAWGYFLLNFDINLGTVSILPQFAGYLLLLSAIRGGLSGLRRDLKLLRPLCVLLAGCAFVDWLLSWRGWELDGMIPFLDLMVSAATLYFHFQLLTDLAALAEDFQPEGSGLNLRLRNQRTIYLLLVTAIALSQSLFQAIIWEWWSWVVLGLGLAACISSLCIMSDLFQLRRCVRDETASSDRIS